jgi:hypothetical protein
MNRPVGQYNIKQMETPKMVNTVWWYVTLTGLIGLVEGILPPLIDSNRDWNSAAICGGAAISGVGAVGLFHGALRRSVAQRKDKTMP